jgi:hypothetical protein
MKKLYILLTTLFILNFAQGQSYLYQGFGSGVWPPAGWTAFPIGPQWSLSPTTNAGGMIPEAHFEGFDYSGTARLISPIINLAEVDTLILSFRYMPELEQDEAPVLGVSTRTAGGPWTNIWETNLKTMNEPREFEVLITPGESGDPNFQFSFFLNGELQQLKNFYLDNIKLYYPESQDGKLDEILTPAHIELPGPVIARVINLGNTIIDQVGVSFITNMGIQHDTLITGLDLGLFDTHVFQFNRWWVSPFGDYILKMWISSVNDKEDPYHPNDTLYKNINYSMPPRPMRPPCFETFTSSTCGPCADCAEVFEPWCEDHPGIVLVKYPMDFPGQGDPYYLPDGGYRREYYDLNSVPWTYINGLRKYNVDTNVLQVPYDSARMLTSDFVINSTFSITNTTITITNNIFPYESVAGTRVHTVVIEKITTGNVGSNGQTEFHNVMMKMFPDGYGEMVNFSANMPYNQTFTADLEETNVEEYDDLMVAVFIQQDSGKYILQSTYAIEDGIFSDEDRLSTITLDGVPVEGFDPDIYQYEFELPISAIEAPVIFGSPMHENAMMVITQSYYLPGSAVIDVYSESRGTMKRYSVQFNLTTNIENPENQAIGIYPNPARNGKLFITGIEDYSLKLFSLDGKLLLSLKSCPDNIIDLSGIKSGVYILSLYNEKGMMIRKKIMVM